MAKLNFGSLELVMFVCAKHGVYVLLFNHTHPGGVDYVQCSTAAIGPRRSHKRCHK